MNNTDYIMHSAFKHDAFTLKTMAKYAHEGPARRWDKFLDVRRMINKVKAFGKSRTNAQHH